MTLEVLERATDKAEDAANVLEAVVLEERLKLHPNLPANGPAGELTSCC